MGDKWARKVKSMDTTQVQQLLDKAYEEVNLPVVADEWRHILQACREEIDHRLRHRSR